MDSERKGLIIDVLVIAATYLIGLIIRILPTFKYGAHLTADDPLLHYRITKALVETGTIPHYDPLSWFPWSFDPTKILPPLHYYTGAAIYLIASALGFKDLYTVVVYIPAFFSPLVVIPLYLLAKDLWGRPAAIISSLAISLSWAYASRSLAGFYRHEQFAIPILMASLYFTVKAIRSEELWKTVLYSGLSGVFLVYASGIWAAFRLLYDGYALFLIILLLLNRLSLKELLALGIPPLYVLVASFGALSNLAFRKLYISFESTLVWAALLASLIYVIAPKLNLSVFKERRREISLAIGILLLVGFLVSGAYHPLTGRLMRVLNPSTKLWHGNVVETVAEHGSGALVETMTTLLIPGTLGLFFLGISRWRNNDEFLLFVLSLASLYFALSIVRLPPIAAPFMALMAGFFTEKVMELFQDKFRKVASLERAMSKRGAKLPLTKKIKMLKAPVITLILLVILPVALQGGIIRYKGTYVFTPLMASEYSLGFSEGWRQTLSWLKNNTEPSDVVISWWDYGYWMQTGAGKITLADGLTINETQIRLIAKAFMGTEEEMLSLANRFNATYVVIDVPAEVGRFSGGGKWVAMAWIAGKFKYSPYRPDEAQKWFTQDLPKYFNVDRNTGMAYPTEQTMNTTLFKMALGAIKEVPLNYFERVFVGKTGGYVHVVVYKLKG